MDLDKVFVSALIREGKDAVLAARDKGVRAELLKGEGQTAFEYIVEHLSTYSQMPTREILEGKLNIQLPDDDGKAEFFADEVLNRALHKDMRSGVTEVIEFLEQRDPHGALDRLQALLRFIRKEHTATRAHISSIPRLFGDVVDYYDRVKSGAKGILTPWPTINEETLGFWPEDLILFAARQSVGKTWAAAIIGHQAWADGHKVLFGTTEISKLRIAMRFAALHFSIPYKELRLAQLGHFEEKNFKNAVKEVMEHEGLEVVGGDFDFKVESWEQAIEQAEPALSVMDGAYLLKCEGSNRLERAANAFDELKRICKRTSVPNVVTSQLNRTANVNVASTIRAEAIALTDTASWNADLIYGMVQTEDMKRDRRMILKPLKVREGEGEDIECNWDLHAMRFDELPKAAVPGGAPPGVGGSPGAAPDPFSTGVLPGSSTDDVPF